MRKLFLLLILCLVPSLVLAEGMECIGDNCYLRGKVDGEMTVQTEDDDDLNLCVDSSGSAKCVTVDGSTGALAMASGTKLQLDLGSIAAAGSDESDATAVVDQLSLVSGADGTKGVILPASTGSGAVLIIHNSDATNALKVYPDASGQINGGTATTGDVAVAAEETAIFVDMGTNVWHGGVAVDF